MGFEPEGTGKAEHSDFIKIFFSMLLKLIYDTKIETIVT